MSAQVLIAHSGQRLRVDSAHQFASVDDFKGWVSRQCRIPLQHVVALTPSGKTVKTVSALNTESDIYVYDMRIIQATSSPSSSLVSESPMPKRFSVANPPNSIANTNELHAWQALFRDRRKWALTVYDDCSRMADTTQARYDEIDVIMKCLDAAVVNLETVVKPIESRYNEFKKWAVPTREEYSLLADNWDHYLTLAQNVPISPAMVRFMTGKEVPKSRRATLEDLIDLPMAEKLGHRSPASLKAFNAKVDELDESAEQMFQGCRDLFREFDVVVNQSALQHAGDAEKLLQDIQPLVNKVDTDYQTTMSFSNTNRDRLHASKMASTHTEKYLPSLRERAIDMDEMLRYATQHRNTLAGGSLEFMRIIAEISTLQGSVKSQMHALTQGVDEMNTFDYLRLVQQLPFMYAAFVAESIRRREWTDKMKSDSITLANEMALFQDEEMKRRRKWQKIVGDTYGPESPSSGVEGLEVNLRGESVQWPTITKDDLQDFLDELYKVEAEPEVVADVQKLLAELTTPTKQQTKRLKAFKNGSVHEAALGRSGLLIRGDNDLIQSLQDDKVRLEGKVRTAESRVRRLEGLLHQQSQASRPSLGNVFSVSHQQLSEKNDSTTSIKSPRIPDDRRRSIEGNDALLQAVQRLEAELAAEKQKSTNLAADLDARITRHADQLAEANSTKKDLLGNMEALQREFDVERKSLEDDIKQLKARIEDTEDEMEHFGESRENEKASYDHKLQDLEHEIERLKKEKADKVLKSQGQVEFLRNESRLQRERNNSLDYQLQASHDVAKGINKELEGAKERIALQTKALSELHVQLSSGEQGPEDVTELVDAVSRKATQILARTQDVERDMSILRSDMEQEQNSAKQLRTELAEAGDQISATESNALRLKESLAEEKARVAILESELATGREQLSDLRTRLSDGETGSESLRRRLEEEEARVSSLTERMAAKQSQVGSLEEELRLNKERSDETQAKLTHMAGRLEKRSERAKDLTQRLYAQNDRLCRLLERLGFTVSRKGASMSIQKVPRAERASMHIAGDSSDPNSSMRKSTTFNNSKPLADSTDLELLHWMKNENLEQEAEKYEAYLETLGNFDMDLFSDTVYKRLKDVEHIARKLQRDTRAYREKAHAYQKEAHEKIAFKNFKEGDLALFLPTRNQTTGAWAAFNVGFPHYFLREQEAHRLRSREWLVARISRVEERVVDLSKSLHQPSETDSLNTEENDNPFDLSDGLRWYLIDAHEDKPGAPSTPGLGKSTVATNVVEAMAERHIHPHVAPTGREGKKKPSPSSIEGVSKALSKSLETRRSSTSSKKGRPFSIGGGGSNRNSAMASETNSLRAAPSETPLATSPTAQHTHPASPGEGKKHTVHRILNVEPNKPEEGVSSAAGGGSLLAQNGDGSATRNGAETENECFPPHSPERNLETGITTRPFPHFQQPQHQEWSSPTRRRSPKGRRSYAPAQQEQQQLRRMHSLESQPGRLSAYQDQAWRPPPGIGGLSPQRQHPQLQHRHLLRQGSSALSGESAAESPSKKSVVWESLWNLDLTSDGRGGR